MSTTIPTGRGDGPRSLGGRLEEVCDRAEAAWKAGRPPRIEDTLGEVPGPGRAELFRALLVMELAYRRRAGERPGPEEYRRRFPGHAGPIESVFAATITSRDDPADPSPTRLEGGYDQPGAIADGPAVAPSDRGTRYQIRRSHALGGLGEVLVAYDREVGREVALKRIQERHADSPEYRARFLREAEITGRLEHPGIVPVYGLGRFDDGRPYYAMRFIEGRSLKEAIGQFHEAELPGRDPGERIVALRGLLRHFVDVCNAVNYAHSRGVLHRDLKPANIMLGPYGETLTVDWGLATPIERQDSPGGVEAATFGRLSGSDVTLTEIGDAMGTPHYMSPEQAEGRWDEVGPASDVFSLGATLGAILSRDPPIGDPGGDVARRDKLAPRKALPGVPRLRALEAIGRKATSPKPEDRYASTRALADDIEHWLAGEPVSAWREPWTTRALRWVGRHRTPFAAGVAASLAAAVAIGVFGLGDAQRNRERAIRVRFALGESAALRQQAESGGVDEARWTKAVDAATHAENLLDAGVEARTQREARAQRRAVEEAARRAEKDRAMLARLVDVRVARTDDMSGALVDAEYAAAFRAYGVDPDTTDPATAGAALRARPSAVAVELASALDDWAAVRLRRTRDPARWGRLIAAAHVADPDRRRDAIRSLLGQSDLPAHREVLRGLANGSQVDGMPPTTVTLLADALVGAGDAVAAEALLRRALVRNPGDAWINHGLATLLRRGRPARIEEAIRFYTAARAVRPETAHDLAITLWERGQADEAISILRHLTRLMPRSVRNHLSLGRHLKQYNDPNDPTGAARAFDTANALGREEVRLRPDDAWAHAQLGDVLYQQAHATVPAAVRDSPALAGAIAAHREAIHLKPDVAYFRANLGGALLARGATDEAIAEFREAIRLEPDEARLHGGLGTALNARGAADEAIAEYRAAIRLDPDDAILHFNLGNRFFARGSLDDAVAEYRTAVRINPAYRQAHHHLVEALLRKGSVEEAIAELREAIRLNLASRSDLIGVLIDAGALDEAVAEGRAAIRVNPGDALTHCRLGEALKRQAKFAEALVVFRRGHELGSPQKGWDVPSASWVQKVERLVELDALLPAVLRGERPPADAAERIEFAALCALKRRYRASAGLYGEAFAAKPELMESREDQHRYNGACAAAQAGSGLGEDDPPPDAAARVGLRAQALEWLRAELAAWAMLVEAGSTEGRIKADEALRQWQVDPDLAGLRDEEWLGKLPQPERDALLTLWGDVAALLRKGPG